MKFIQCCLAISVFYLVACSTPTRPASEDSTSKPDAALVKRAGAPLFNNLGDFNRNITTRNKDAQRYFNQGMVLAFGFNHAEAIRSFRAAQLLDPDCAMCFWGEALATGPNINVTSKGKAIMSPEERVAAFNALSRAQSLRVKASAPERDLIDALAFRYNGDASTDREPLDRAYAEAMRHYVDKYPDDDDAMALYAEAWMNTMPWNYWSDDGTPRAETVAVVDALEAILARSPNHPLALHLYIHAVEASSNPGRAESAADRLNGLVPGAGHLVHMPAHIYWRVGRYHDAAEANVRAADVDEAYIAQCNAQGFYPALYYPHNIHFLWAASSMAGRQSVAITAANKLAANVHLEQIEQFPTIEFFKTIPLLALVQFGQWQEIMNAPPPPANLDYSNAIWHYARGVAHASNGQPDAAQKERAALIRFKDTTQINFMNNADYPAGVLLNIADNLLQGDISMAQDHAGQAINYYQQAVTLQDGLPYMEPPFWYYPSRQSLGKALIKAQRYAEAENVYRRDLEDYPLNGWSMFGLIQSLEAQGKNPEAKKYQAMFEKIWAMAEVELSSSRI